VANAGQSLAPEAVCAYVTQILELVEFRGGESFAENGEILFLWGVSQQGTRKKREGGSVCVVDPQQCHDHCL